ncbi:MAG TPA: hypothetical protein VFU81_00715, partial [Thermomicrobiales bacterium]|nr:hypothetical protein [Thermomicrobiales bacterium]
AAPTSAPANSDSFAGSRRRAGKSATPVGSIGDIEGMTARLEATPPAAVAADPDLRAALTRLRDAIDTLLAVSPARRA